MDNIKRSLSQFIKAQVSASGSSAVDFLVTIFLTEVIQLWYVYSNFIGACSGGICNCVTNYKWVFKVKDKKKKDIAWRYTLVWGTSIALNTMGTAFIKESFDINYLYSKIITAICVAVCWNYQMQQKFVFKKI